MGSDGSKWVQMCAHLCVQMCPNVLKLVHIQVQMVQMSPDGFKWVQIGPGGSRWVQMGPDGSKWVQMGLNESKKVQMSSNGFIYRSKWAQNLGPIWV